MQCIDIDTLPFTAVHCIGWGEAQLLPLPSHPCASDPDQPRLRPFRPCSVGWFASLRELNDTGEWVHQCGGMMIDQTHVLTAAHVSTFAWKRAGGTLIAVEDFGQGRAERQRHH